jgi:hypothetical protein
MSDAENSGNNKNSAKEKVELVSGLVDEQLSEIEIHKLLRRHDDETRDSFIRYGQIRAAVRGERLYSNADNLALHERIRVAVEAEELSAGSAPGLVAAPRLRRVPVIGLAVAASLVIAVSAEFYFSGGKTGDGGADLVSETRAVSAGSGPDTARVQLGGGNAAQSLPVSPVQPTLAQPASTELRELDAAKQGRLRMYLNRHERVSRINPNLRVVTSENRR